MTLTETPLHQLYTLKRATIINGPHGKRKAMHKPCLLLAVFQQIQEGYLTPDRIEASQALFTRYHDLLFHADMYCDSTPMPFFRLENDGIWKPHLNNGETSSWEVLHQQRAFASFSPQWQSFLQSPESLNKAIDTLLRLYFQKQGSTSLESHVDLAASMDEIYNDDSRRTAKKISQLITVRDSRFARKVMLAYDFTCCISGYQAKSEIARGLLDACHIQPHAKQHNNSINNGIPLLPHYHRAFDLGHFSIDDDYKMMVHHDIRILPVHELHPLRNLHGRSILLPKNRANYPKKIFLREHRNTFGYEQ